MLTGLCNSPNQRLFWTQKAVGSINRAERSYQQYFNYCYSVFFWHLLLWEQMTKEVPGIRPAVISTETGTRLYEYRRFRHVVRNVYTRSFDPAKLGKLVHSAPERFARTKAELLAFAAFLALFAGLVLKLRPTLLPYFMIVHALMDLSLSLFI